MENKALKNVLTSEEIINGPINQTGLSVMTIELFRKMGYQAISSILLNEIPTYEEFHNRIMKAAKIYYKNNEEELNEIQHAYNELVQYIEYHGIKLKKEPKYDIIGMADSDKLERIIFKKLDYFVQADSESVKESLENHVKQIVDLNSCISGLDDVETLIVRFMCGIYTKGKEQTIEQTERRLIDAGYKVEKVGIVFYNALYKIVEQIKTEQETIEK